MKSNNKCPRTTKPFGDLPAKPLSRQASRRIERSLAHDDAMFSRKPQYAIVIVTLTYDDRWKPWKTIEDLRRDRDTLLNNKPFNTLLRNISGYVWKIEEGGEVGGLHVHLVIYYAAENMKGMHGDVRIAKDIKAYWNDVVTKGSGYAWNHNENKERNALGPYGDITGLIDKGSDKHQRFRNYMTEYVCKEEQQVEGRAPHWRMFGTSQLSNCT